MQTPRQKRLLARFERECQELATEEHDVRSLAGKFGLSEHMRGKDVPKKIRLIPLYTKTRCKGFIGKTYSIALGMRRSAQDVKEGLVNGYWSFLDRPEKTYANYLLVESRVPETQLVQTNDVTGFAKFHLRVPAVGAPVLFLNPVQKIGVSPASIEVVHREFRQKLERAKSSRERHKLKWKLRNLERKYEEQVESAGSSVDVFENKDRHLVIALVALRLARALGVKRIGLPSERKIREWEQTLRKKNLYRKALVPEAVVGEEPRVRQLYQGVREVLEAGAKKLGIKIV